VDDAIFLLGLVGVPLLVGAVLGYLQRPWWWAAVAAVVIFLLLVIIPAPEEGESRVAGGDIVFLLVASLIVAALAWVGAFLGRWLARRRGAVH
jgi:peptidoglycan/LPS O-acetylase OafA/YrhL